MAKEEIIFAFEVGEQRNDAYLQEENKILIQEDGSGRLYHEAHDMDDFHASWSKGSCEIPKDVLDDAIETILERGEVELRELIQYHEHVWGRDDNGEFDENNSYNIKLRITHKNLSDPPKIAISWTRS